MELLSILDVQFGVTCKKGDFPLAFLDICKNTGVMAPLRLCSSMSPQRAWWFIIQHVL